MNKKTYLFHALIFLGYFFSAKLGQVYASNLELASPIWPASGITLLAFYYLGRKAWLAVFSAAFLANYPTGSYLSSSAVALCCVIEGLVGSIILTRLLKKEKNLSEFFGFLLTALIGPVISAAMGSIWVVLQNSEIGFLETWYPWWSGHGLGILFLAPFLYNFIKVIKNKSLRPIKILTLGIAVFSIHLAAYLSFTLGVGEKFLLAFHPLLLFLALYVSSFSLRTLFVAVACSSLYWNSQNLELLQSGVQHSNVTTLQLLLTSLALLSISVHNVKSLQKKKYVIAPLLIGWSLSTVLFYVFIKAEKQKDRKHVQLLIKNLHTELQEEIGLIENTVRGAMSFVGASGSITRTQWKSFFETYEIQKMSPGVNGLGITYPVKRRDLPAYLREQQKEIPEFKYQSFDPTLNPPELSQIITVVEPSHTLRPILGFDFMTEPRRLETVIAAIDSGSGKMTGKLSSPLDPKKNPTMLLLVPLYNKTKPQTISERRSSIRAIVYAAIRLEDLLTPIFKKSTKEMSLDLYQGKIKSSDDLLFTNSIRSFSAPELEEDFILYGRTFHAVWKKTPLFLSNNDTTAAWILISGGIITFLITGIFFGMQTANEEAHKKEEEETEFSSKLQEAFDHVSTSESKFRELADSMPTIIWISSPEGIPIYYNKRWYEIIGAELSSNPNEAWTQISPEQDVDLINQAWKKALEEQGVLEAQLRIFDSKLQMYRWHLVRSIPVLDENGKVKKWYGTSTDIHEFKTLEIEKEKSAARELAAIETAKIKSEFLANMSHEIRTPLNGILGITELLSKTQTTEDQKEFIEDLQFSGSALLQIINDILDLSKVEAGKLELEEETFNLHKLIANTQRIFAYEANQKGLGLRIQRDAFPDHFIGDEMRIQQIFFNLLSNAFKFTEKGEIIFRIKVVRESQSTMTLKFEVEDSGIGVTEEVMKKIFRPFTQADTSTNRRFGGTGLGLSICKRLVEKMNGQIGVESNHMSGATFWFQIELQKAIDEISEVRKPVIQRSFLGIETLVAEDFHINKKIIKAMLEGLGARVDLASNGIECLELSRHKRYDIILMDCHMPDMDGFETTERLRSDPTDLNNHTPVIALTADVLEDNKQRTKQSGMNDFLAKPYAPNELSEVLQKWTFREGDKLVNLQTRKNLFEIDGTGELLKNLKNMFEDYQHEFFLQAREHLEKNETGEIKFKIHQFKASALNLGLERVGEIGHRIEANLTDGYSRETITRMINQLQIETDRSLAVFNSSL